MEVTSILIFLLIAIISLAVYFVKQNLNYWKNQGIPHEEPHILVGNFGGARTELSIGEIVANYYRKFKDTGPFAGIHMVQRPAVVILDIDLLKKILIKDFNNFTNRGLYYNEKDDPLTGHLFFVDSPKWRIMRNKLSPTFSSGKIKNMYPTLLKLADQCIDVLSAKVKEDPIVDVRELLSRFTIDIIGNVAFGIEINSLKDPNSEFPRLGKKILGAPRHNPLIMAFIDGFPKLARKLGMRVVSEDVHQFFMKTISQTIEYRISHQIQRNDFLNILIELKNNEKNDDKDGMSIAAMVAEVLGFFLGGFETTSSTMSFALYELALHPELQERLREEVNEAFEKDQESGFSFDTIKSMTYLDQVVSETLRKYPIVPVLNRQAINDYVVPGHPKYVIKRGTPILIPALGIHHDPEFYPNPEEFDPERFSPDMVKQRNSVEWLAFGDGPRNCIGERFGQMQSRLGVAVLVKKFRFSVCSKTKIPLGIDPVSATYVPKHIIYLKVEKI